MNMKKSKNKIEFVKEEVEKSGFPLEIEIASILEKDGWEVLPSSPYLDKDEKKWREIDIKAYKSIDQASDSKSIEPYHLSLALIIECKRSKKYAWVFFPRPRKKKEMKLTTAKFLDFITITKRQSLLKAERLTSPIELQMLNMDTSIISEKAVIASQTAKLLKFFSELRIITPESFRFLTNPMKAIHGKEIKMEGKSSEPHKIFEAINMSIKAMKYDLLNLSHFIYLKVLSAKSGFSQPIFEIMVFIPIIIFDGDLYIWIDNDIKVGEKILFEGKCKSRHHLETMFINILKKSYFKKFLSEIKEDANSIADQIYRNRRKLDEQRKIIMGSPSPSTELQVR